MGKPTVTRPCAQCGIEFILRFPAETQKCCSTKCGYDSLRNTPERFWARVAKDGECWLWTGSTNGKGYGIGCMFNGTRISAHRLAWQLTYGSIPDGLDVCHKCDNPPCCRPEHLFTGTRKDNMQDASKKGRMAKGDAHPWRSRPEIVPRGENHSRTKLTNAQVIEIRARYRDEPTATHVSLAREYGIGRGGIEGILKRKSWKHI